MMASWDIVYLVRARLTLNWRTIEHLLETVKRELNRSPRPLQIVFVHVWHPIREETDIITCALRKSYRVA